MPRDSNGELRRYTCASRIELLKDLRPACFTIRYGILATLRAPQTKFFSYESTGCRLFFMAVGENGVGSTTGR